MKSNFEKLAEIAGVHGSLQNMRENMEMKHFAKEVLLPENYEKFMKSYNYTFWFQLIGVLAGFIVPCTLLPIIFRNFDYCLFGAAFGIFWAIIWMIISQLIPPTKIYRKFAKWFRKGSRLEELDAIFYEEK